MIKGLLKVNICDRLSVAQANKQTWMCEVVMATFVSIYFDALHV